MSNQIASATPSSTASVPPSATPAADTGGSQIAARPLEPQARALEGYRLASEAAPGSEGLQSRAIADAAGSARTALERTDLPAQQATTLRHSVEQIGNAVVDGKLGVPLDPKLNQSLYDLATAPAGSTRFDQALAHVNLGAEVLNEPGQPAGETDSSAEAPAPAAEANKRTFYGDKPFFDASAAKEGDVRFKQQRDGSVVITDGDGVKARRAGRPIGDNDAFKVKQLQAQSPQAQLGYLERAAQSIGGDKLASTTKNVLFLLKTVGGDADAKVKATVLNRVELECSAVEQRCAAKVSLPGHNGLTEVSATPTEGGFNVEIKGEKHFLPTSGEGARWLDKLRPLPEREPAPRAAEAQAALKDGVRKLLPEGTPDKLVDMAANKVLDRLPNLIRNGEYGFNATVLDKPGLKVEVSVGGSVPKAVENVTRASAKAFVNWVINDIMPPGMAAPNLSNVINR